METTVTLEKTKTTPVPLIHTADLYHPPCDPDDHWDVACLFALAKMGQIDLLGIVIDYPLPPDENGIVHAGAGEPAVQAVAQLNYITQKTVVASVGSNIPFKQFFDGNGRNPSDFPGIKFILDTLRKSPQPVVISIAGSCRDVAIAGKIAPGLFQEKCAAIYLNAGTATFNTPYASQQEWNVALDPWAYRQIFELPCPIYWMPCFDDLSKFESHTHGTYWRFRQGDVLAHLSPRVQNYLLYALTRNTDQRWLSHILGSVNTSALEIQNNSYRNMWCTAGFLHLARLMVNLSGEIVPLLNTPDTDTLFHFRPVRVQLDETGTTRWEFTEQPENRYLFEIKDLDKYRTLMPIVLRKLLEQL